MVELTLGWTFIGVGLLIAALAVPLALGKVPMNRWYGFRTPRTVSDPRLWAPVNTMAGRTMIPMGAVYVLLGALVLLGTVSAEVVGLVSGLVSFVPVLWMMWRASVIAAEIDGRLPTSHEEATTSTAPEAEAPEAVRRPRPEAERAR